MIEADLHQVYGIDVETPEILRKRTWRWLRLRIAGLLGVEHSRLRHKLTPAD